MTEHIYQAIKVWAIDSREVTIVTGERVTQPFSHSLSSEYFHWIVIRDRD